MAVLITKQTQNIRDVLNSLKKRTGAIGDMLLKASTKEEVYSAIKPFSFRNKLINGGFDIWQRGTSFTNHGGYTADRWTSQSNPTGSVVSRQSFTAGQTEVPGNPKYFYRLAINNTDSGAADRIAIRQMVEDYEQFVGKTVILSGWYRCTAGIAGGNWLFQMKRSSGFYDNASEISDSRNTTLDPSVTWKYFERKVYVPSDVLKTQTMTGTASFAIVYYYQSANKTGNIDLANLQLEIDSSTPFEYRPYVLELDLCKRYCQVFGGTGQYEHIGQGSAYTSGNAAIDVTFSPEMRTVPSISASGNWALSDGITNTAVTSYSLASNGAESSGKRLGLVALTGGTALTQFRPYVLFPNADSSARFIASAEL